MRIGSVVLIVAFVMSVPAGIAARAAMPVVTGFAPRTAPIDAQITITGRYLGGAHVRIGSKPALHVRVNKAGTRVVASVPPTVKIGHEPVAVTTAAGTVRAPGLLTVEPLP